MTEFICSGNQACIEMQKIKNASLAKHFYNFSIILPQNKKDADCQITNSTIYSKRTNKQKNKQRFGKIHHELKF